MDEFLEYLTELQKRLNILPPQIMFLSKVYNSNIEKVNLEENEKINDFFYNLTFEFYEICLELFQISRETIKDMQPRPLTQSLYKNLHDLEEKIRDMGDLLERFDEE